MSLPEGIDWGGALLWGFLATVVLTIIIATGQGMGITRMNLAWLLGTFFSRDRDRARTIGMGVHFLFGLLFALLYAAAFERLDRATWWIGGVFGLVHALFVLGAVVTLLPGIHPRMASEHRPPTTGRPLEPPGFLALNYGTGTPPTVIIAHIAFGVIFGALYRVG